MIAVAVSAARAFAAVTTTQIEAIFTSLRSTNAPGAAVLVLRHGEPVFRRGYGVTDLRTLTPIGPEANFRLASFTKQFTAASIMLLVHDGKLNYDEHLSGFFEFPEYGKPITVRHLLNHVSGLPAYEDLLAKRYSGMPEGRIPQILDEGVLRLLAEQTSARFPAGSKWEYSNSGYAVLALIAEKVSGKRFGQFLNERIFLPLKMDHSVAYEKGRNEVAHWAYGHTRQADGWHETDQSPTSAVLGDGGIYSSLDDLAKWDRALRDHTLLTETEMRPALTPVQLSGGGKEDYGFGWRLDSYRGHKRMWHGGDTIGFRTAIERFPDDHLTVIVLANRADLDSPALALKIADLYLAAGEEMESRRAQEGTNASSNSSNR